MSEFTVVTDKKSGLDYHEVVLPNGGVVKRVGEKGLAEIGTLIRKALFEIGSNAEFDQMQQDALQRYIETMAEDVKGTFQFVDGSFADGELTVASTGEFISNIEPENFEEPDYSRAP